MNTELRQSMLESLKEGIRFDGRKFDEFRPVSVETDVSKSAEGSAKVKIGETEVLAGVKLEMGTPYPDNPDEGTIIVGAELLPLSSPDFESGPPGIQAVELARVVDRGLRESKALDFKKLCVKKGEQVWLAIIDIVTVNDAGNLFDASALAALAALKSTCFPAFDGEKVNYKEKTTKKLPVEGSPLSVTVYKVGTHYFIDPTPEEERAYDARLTVATLDDGTLCALQKGEVGPLTGKDIDQMVSIAVDKTKELRKHLP